MANATYIDVLLDGPRNYVVKYTGILDTSDVSVTSIILKTDPTNNDVAMKGIWGFRVDHIEYSVSDQLSCQLFYHATTNRQIVSLEGRGFFGHTNSGGIIPVRGDTGFNGAIDFKTTGWASGTQAFSITLELVKLYDVS